MYALIAALLELVPVLEIGEIFIEAPKPVPPEPPKILDVRLSALIVPEISIILTPTLEFYELPAIFIELLEIASINIALIITSLPVVPT